MKIICALLLNLLCSNIIADTLKVGTLTTNPPFSMEAANQNGHQYFTGFDISIMNEICRLMHDTCNFQAMNFHDLGKAVDSGVIDIAIAAIIITPERRQKYNFSMPYLASRIQFVTMKNSSFKTISDLKEKTVGVYTNSPADLWLLNNYTYQFKTKEFEHSEALFKALTEGDIDALVTSYQNAMYWHNNISSNFNLLDKPFSIGQGYGIMAKKDNHFLINKINNALQEIEQNGTYLKLYQNNLTE